MSQKQVARSGFAAFVPRARLLRLIGSELISDEVVAVTELVKNAHDADASFISVQFVNVTSGEGEIIIRDDGHGMDVDTLLTRWMQPAGSMKGRNGFRLTPGGRRLLGEKGVGRFATDKLAARLEMVSRERGDSSEVHAVFDWDEFEADDLMLSDVQSKWEVRPADWLDSHGTMLRLTRLRTRWSERMFRRLSTRLARLVSPFESKAGFRIVIQSDEFPSYSGEVSSGFLDQAPYTLQATFDGDSVAVLRLNGARPERHVLAHDERPRCGAVSVRLFAFDLETEALARIGPRAEVRAWLREWSGISVYRDGFRVWPYGEPHDDWLRLDQRRVNNPVVRLSNNQIVGFVEISTDQNPGLRDQTNREGLIHNAEYEDLQRFILFAMQIVEAARQSLRHPKTRQPIRGGTTASPGASLPEQLELLASRSNASVAEDLKKLATRARSTHAAEAVAQQRMLEGYTELAAAGQTAALVGRSMSACLDAVQTACTTLQQSFRRESFEDAITTSATLAKLRHAIESASVQLRSMTDIQGAGRRRRALDVVAELRRIAELADPLLQEHDATIDIQEKPDADLVLRTEMRPELFASVITAMIMNSLQWKHAQRPLKIAASLRTVDDHVEILFSDNGKGVKPGLENSIFSPMVSGREDAAGMGLTIARSVIANHGGSIDLVADRRRKGAAFRVLLPRKKARATMS